jgi:cytoskeleton protein RodZ
MALREEEAQDPGTGPKLSPGRLIAQSREAHSLSASALATRLRLDPKIVQALERDDFENLPAPMFIKGYIRAISKELNLDAEVVLSAYHGLAVIDPPPLADFASRAPMQVGVNSGVIKAVTFGLIGLLVLLIVTWWRSQGDVPRAVEETVTEQQIQRDDPIDLLTSPDLEASIDAPGWPLNVKQEEFVEGYLDLESQADSVSEPSSEAPSEPESSSENDALVTELEAQGESSSQPDSQQLVIKTKNEAWVEIYAADGSELFFGLAKANKPIELDGYPYYRLIVGNTDSVTLQHATKDVEIKSLAVDGVAQLELGTKPVARDEPR